MTIQSLCEALLSAGLSNAGLASLLIIVAIAAYRCCKSPAVVSAIWVLVFLKLITPPLVTIPTGIRLWPKGDLAVPESKVTFDSTDGVQQSPIAINLTGRRLPEDGAADNKLVRLTPEITTMPRHNTVFDTIVLNTAARALDDVTHHPSPIKQPTPAQPVQRTPSIIPWSTVVQVLVGCWLAGSIFLASVVAIRLMRFRSLLHRCQPTPSWIVENVSAIAASVGLRNVPCVQTVECQLAPSVGCWGFKPTIVLPHQFFLSLSPAERRSLIAHELAHIVRKDHWRAWLELVAVILFWWFLPVWFARRESRRITEICCDDWVMNWFPGSAVEYVETLIKSVDFVSSTGQGMPAIIHGMGEFSNMKRRIVTIFGGRRTPQLSLSQRGLIGILAVTTLLVGLGWGPIANESHDLNANEERPAIEWASPVVQTSVPKVGDRVFVIETTEVRGDNQQTWKVDRGVFFKVESIAEDTLIVKGDSKSGAVDITGEISSKSVATAGDAFDVFTHQIQLNPNDAMAYMARGLLATLESDPNAALEDFNESIRLAPDHALSYALRSRAWNQKKQLTKSIKDCTEAIRLDPECELAYELRMGARMITLVEGVPTKDDLQEAKKDADEVVRLRSNDSSASVLAFSMGQALKLIEHQEEQTTKLTATINALTPTTAEQTSKSVKLLLRRATAYTERRLSDLALADYSKVIELDPKCIKAFRGRVKILIDQQENDKAITDCSAIIELDPEDEEAYCQRGRCFNRLKNYDSAIADLDTAVRLNAKSKSAYYERGLAWMQKGNEEQAFEDFSMAIRYPLNEAKFGVGVGARNHFTAFAEIGSKPQAAAYCQRGKLYTKRQEFDKAIADYKTGIQKAPKDVESSTQLAWLLAACPNAELRNGEKAIEIARTTCKESHWELADSIQALAAAYAETGNFKKAIQYQQKAGKLYGSEAPSDWKLRLNLYQASQPYRLGPMQIAEREKTSESK